MAETIEGGAASATAQKSLPEKLATAIVAASLPAIAADAGFVAVLADDGQTVNVLRVTPFSETPIRLTFPLDAPYPLAETIRIRQPLFIESNEQLACDHPGLVRIADEDHACATIPLVDDGGEILGALNLAFDEPHKFSDKELELIDVLGRECRQAMLLGRRVRDELAGRALAES
jgi:GAF domain-containing protein